MTAPKNDAFWFVVAHDIPEIGAYPADLVMVKGNDVWICKKKPDTWVGPGYFMDRLWALDLTALPSAVSEPIAASSDDAALFELIYSTGGRMPEA